MNVETPEVQIARLLEALRNPIGIFMALALLVTLVTMACGRRSKWGLITLLLFFAPMMIAIAPHLRYISAIVPFHQFRTYGRPICGALLILALIPTFNSYRGWRHRIIFFPAFAFLLLELVFCIRNIAGGSALRGSMSIGIFLLTFTVLGYALGRWLQSIKDARALLRAVAMATLFFVAACLVQLLVNTRAIVAQNRLYGLTGNPQHAGMMLAASLPVVAFLVVWKEEVKAMRIVWAVLAAVMTILLAWTGSRTGFLMSFVGLGLLFRRHLGRFFGFGVICAVLVLLVLQIFDFDISESSGRLFNTTNTRKEIWGRMLGDFFANMAVGVPEQQAFGSESSYLLVAARLGIVGLIPLFVMLVSIGFAVIRLHAYRKVMRDHSLLVDLAIGGMAAILTGALFEGILLGTLSHPVFMIYIYLAMFAFLLDLAEAQAAQPAFEPAGHVEDEQAYADEYAAHGQPVAPF